MPDLSPGNSNQFPPHEPSSAPWVFHGNITQSRAQPFPVGWGSGSMASRQRLVGLKSKSNQSLIACACLLACSLPHFVPRHQSSPYLSASPKRSPNDTPGWLWGSVNRTRSQPQRREAKQGNGILFAQPRLRPQVEFPIRLTVLTCTPRVELQIRLAVPTCAPRVELQIRVAVSTCTTRVGLRLKPWSRVEPWLWLRPRLGSGRVPALVLGQEPARL